MAEKETPPAEGQPSRARERAPQPLTGITEARIAHIAELMRTLKFKSGKTAKLLAKEWGLSVSRVWKLTAKASKRVRAEVNDPDVVGANVGVALMRALEDELAKGSKKNGRVIADLARTWADITGAKAPGRHDVRVAGVSIDDALAANNAIEKNG